MQECLRSIFRTRSKFRGWEDDEFNVGIGDLSQCLLETVSRWMSARSMHGLDDYWKLLTACFKQRNELLLSSDDMHCKPSNQSCVQAHVIHWNTRLPISKAGCMTNQLSRHAVFIGTSLLGGFQYCCVFCTIDIHFSYSGLVFTVSHYAGNYRARFFFLKAICKW